MGWVARDVTSRGNGMAEKKLASLANDVGLARTHFSHHPIVKYAPCPERGLAAHRDTDTAEVDFGLLNNESPLFLSHCQSYLSIHDSDLLLPLMRTIANRQIFLLSGQSTAKRAKRRF